MVACGSGTIGALSALEKMVGELKRWRNKYKAQIANRQLTWKLEEVI